MVRSTNSTTSSKSSIFIALALAIGALYFGRQIFIPLALALVLSFLLTPWSALLERGRLGRLPAVLVVLVFCFALTASAGWEVAGQLLDITGHIRDYKDEPRRNHSLASSSGERRLWASNRYGTRVKQRAGRSPCASRSRARQMSQRHRARLAPFRSR